MNRLVVFVVTGLCLVGWLPPAQACGPPLPVANQVLPSANAIDVPVNAVVSFDLLTGYTESNVVVSVEPAGMAPVAHEVRRIAANRFGVFLDQELPAQTDVLVTFDVDGITSDTTFTTGDVADTQPPQAPEGLDISIGEFHEPTDSATCGWPARWDVEVNWQRVDEVAYVINGTEPVGFINPALTVTNPAAPPAPEFAREYDANKDVTVRVCAIDLAGNTTCTIEHAIGRLGAPDDSGCSCAMQKTTAPRTGVAVLAAFALLLLRRRQGVVIANS